LLRRLDPGHLADRQSAIVFVGQGRAAALRVVEAGVAAAAAGVVQPAAVGLARPPHRAAQAAGLALQAADRLGLTYWGFVGIFLLGAAARFASAWHLQRMHDPGGHVAALEAPWHADLWQGLKETGLLRFSLFHACMQFAVGIASPFF